MLTKLRIKGFKAWKDTGAIRLAPLTVIFGANSAGKSSLGHLLLALKQTAASTDRRRALHTGDDNSLIDLGTFIESLHGHDRKALLEFELEWSVPEGLVVENPTNEKDRYQGTRLSLESTLAADAHEQPVVRQIRYELRDDGGRSALRVTLARGADGKESLKADPYRLVKAQGRKWPLEPAEKFYRISERSLSRYQNADFLALFALEVERILASVSYLGPLRAAPRRVYGWSGGAPEDVGQRGESAIAALLAAEAERRLLNRGYKLKKESFGVFIAKWLQDLGVIESFAVVPTAGGRKDYEVRVKTKGTSTSVALPDVGFGISQVLPALVQAFYCRPGSTVWMEQPEIHLHPRVQAALADAFISAIQSYEGGQPRQAQLIVETHSEHFLNRLQRRVAEGAIERTDVAIYFVKAGSSGAELEELELNEFGDITNWPDDFFGDDMADIVARTQAAAARRASAAK